MKKARMNISHFHFILFNLKIFDEILVTTFYISTRQCLELRPCFQLENAVAPEAPVVSFCSSISVSQAGITALTLIQGFEEKNKNNEG